MWTLCNRFAVATAVSLFLLGGAAHSQTVKVADKAVYTAVQQLSRSDKGINDFYATRSYKPIWSGSGASKRKRTLINALEESSKHGLPTARYNIEQLKAAFKSRDKQLIESAGTKAFLAYAHDLSSGVLVPSSIDPELAFSNPRRGSANILDSFVKSNPARFLEALAPSSDVYGKLLSEKVRLENAIAQGNGAVTVPLQMLRPGKTSKNVVLLRKRLEQMGYGELGVSPTYDNSLVAIVKKFQSDKGLGADGVAGPNTIRAMNSSSGQQLKQVLVNLERERWMNFPRGKRHIIVNLAEFKARVFDNGRESFVTRTVIGKVSKDRTPEFHDQMTHMVINPTWHVPRSIAGKEYLPILRKDPGFLRRRGMTMLNSSGKSINPANVSLAGYNEKNFPYSIKQKPSKSNALGLVKFMFPNKYNIYLHDTPSKSLFNKEVRAFSHGCVRVHRPFELAYLLLAPQTRDPKATFTHFLDTGKEQYVNLATPVPVYLNYNTVVFEANGQVIYRSDIYGRDATVFKALSRAGVALNGLQG